MSRLSAPLVAFVATGAPLVSPVLGTVDARERGILFGDQGMFSARPEVECIGKGKAHRHEFRVKVSVATMLAHAKGGQFVSHVKALPGIACVRRFSWWNLTGLF